MSHLVKGLFGFLSGLTAAVAANPEAVTTLAGAADAGKVGAIVVIMNAFFRFFKKGEK